MKVPTQDIDSFIHKHLSDIHGVYRIARNKLNTTQYEIYASNDKVQKTIQKITKHLTTKKIYLDIKLIIDNSHESDDGVHGLSSSESGMYGLYGITYGDYKKKFDILYELMEMYDISYDDWTEKSFDKKHGKKNIPSQEVEEDLIEEEIEKEIE